MISYIKGVVESIENDKVIVDNNDIGYGIYMPMASLEILGVGEEVKVHTYLNVREDAMQLFGFLSKEDLVIFKLLIGVSGVGPKGAMAIISTCPGDSLHMAILSGDAKAISKSPGIGAKTAQRIIIELKDKVDIEEVIGIDTTSAKSPQMNGIKADAVEALVALGYSQSDSFKAVNKVPNAETLDVEAILKQALKLMI